MSIHNWYLIGSLFPGSSYTRKKGEITHVDICVMYSKSIVSAVNFSWPVLNVKISGLSLPSQWQLQKNCLAVSCQKRNPVRKHLGQLQHHQRRPSLQWIIFWAQLIHCFKYNVLIKKVSFMTSWELQRT